MMPDNPHWAQGEQEESADERPRSAGSTSSVEQAVHFMGATGQDNAMAIADGVKAWKTLTDGKGPLWRRFNEKKDKVEQSSQQESHDEAGGSDAGKEAEPPPGHPPIDKEDSNSMVCPFQSMAHLGDKQDEDHRGSATRRPDSLPTPPPAEELAHGPLPSLAPDPSISPPPSVAGSASKCPIRMLDERSPEEIAEYFETHKHEIPRSHEICVKRYQTNSESIRQLDAKYGNLINMIQGLGIKHQPLLPAKEDEQSFAEMDAKSARKVEKWADDLGGFPRTGSARDRELDRGPSQTENAENQDIHSSMVMESDRQGHFDRPLKEIRVGESPSRPWGISVPGPGITVISEHTNTIAPAEKAGDANPQQDAPGMKAKPTTKEKVKKGTGEQSGMVFTGPVFIGYNAEQAAELIQKCGWEASGPSAGSA